MADVISLESRRAVTVRVPSDTPVARTAEIVIFPGVRYEYHVGPQPKPRRRSKRRDRLERAE